MLADLRKIWSVFTPAERRRSLWMLLLVVLMAMAETGGVISIVPFLSVLSRPGIIHDNHWLNLAYTYFHFHDRRSFIVALGLA
ncbi:MAG TPA: hypothetical protein VFQ88_16320, partial [Nevskiaceae bacterium]|nr:hypothetical protein [Nevskiaceae bacterium]